MSSLTFRNVRNTDGEYNVPFEGVIINNEKIAVKDVVVFITFFDPDDRVIPVRSLLDYLIGPGVLAHPVKIHYGHPSKRFPPDGAGGCEW